MVEGREKEESESDIVRLIDAALNQPISNAAKAELLSYRTQAETATLLPDDRNYVIARCRRLLRGKSEPYQYPDLKNTREHAAEPGYRSRTTGVLALVAGGLFFVPLVIGGWLLAALLVYGVIVIIFRYAFGVELWNPFN
jgi:hypothetical protein